MLKQSLQLIGYGIGIAGPDSGSAEGPYVLQKSSVPAVTWQNILTMETKVSQLAAIAPIADVCGKLAVLAQKNSLSHTPFVVIGGDHSSAIGTWSGVSAASHPQDIGLIWIDAHLDSHTPESSHSKNVHGMPLAALLGYGDKRLTQILNPQSKIKPENLCIIGVRSFEAEEAELLKQLGVKIFWMEDVHQSGLIAIFQQAIKHVTQHTATYGISLDLDAIDPKDAPGVTVQEPDGIKAQELLICLQQIAKSQLPCALEIAEFNPKKDIDQRTEKLIWSLINTVYKFKE